MIADPILIVGTERSGSNLLRLILNAHSRIVVPHPPHVMRYFTPLLPAYGDLADEAKLRRLAVDVARLVDNHIYRWDHPVDPERLVHEAAPRDLLGLYFAMMEQAREAAGKARWGCKSTFMVHHIAEVVAARPGARFLFLVRDVRDVAASARRSVFSTFHPYFTAQLWQEEQARGLEAMERWPQAVLHVAYERLVARPEEVIREICTFLGEQFEPAMLRPSETPEARKSASLSESWAKTGEPINDASIARFRKDLTDREIALVEWVASAEMAALGYATLNDPAAIPPPSAAERARFTVEERWSQLRVEARSWRHDANVGRRWARGALLGWLRLKARVRGST